jgi:RuvC nuclease domain/Alpha helical recognition lobe domain
MQNTFYDKMIGLYPISKTLRFELVPSEYTIKSLNFDRDEELKDYYPVVKEKLDEFHIEFINRSLSKHYCELNDFFSLYTSFLSLKKNKKNKKKEFEAGLDLFNLELEKLRVSIVSTFDQNAKIINEALESKDYHNLNNDIEDSEEDKSSTKDKHLKQNILSAKILEIVKKIEIEKNNELGVKAFQKFDKFSSYFTGFHRTRENIYSTKEQKTSITYRLINENLLRFCDNIIENDQYKELEEFSKYQYLFDINYFNKSIAQAGIDKYNELIGEYKSNINLYLQSIKKESKKSKFKNLYKLMLTKRLSIFEVQDNFTIQKLIEKLFNEVNNIEELNLKTKDFLMTPDKLNGVYINSKFLTSLSAMCFGGSNFGIIKNHLLKNKLASKKKEEIKLDQFIELKEFITILGDLKTDYSIPSKIFNAGLFESKIINDNESFGICFLKTITNHFEDVLLEYRENKSKLNEHIIGKKEYKKDTEIKLNNEKQKYNAILKNYSDSCLKMEQFIKTFELYHNKKDYSAEFEINEEFYSLINPILEIGVHNYYNIFRNYSTKKTFSNDKIKINFDNATLLDGWSKSKEKNNFGILIKNKNQLDLIVLKPKYKNLFDDTSEIYNSKSDYTKMEYYLLGGASKQIPKGLFAKKNIDLFSEILTPKLLLIRKNKTFTKKFLVKDDLTYWIDSIKKAVLLSPNWKKFDFKFAKESKDYEDVSYFYKELDKQGYLINFKNINIQLLEEYEKDNKLYRFKIKNQDNNPKSNINKSDKKNLYSIYWDNLFTENNLKQVILKLNGEAEIFRRKASIKKEVDPLRKANHEIIISQRYTEDKLFLHVPINFNHTNQNITRIEDYNELIMNNIDQKKLKYLGVDRGENNLVYITLIDNLGNIIRQEDLNTFNNVNYAEKLAKRVNNRDQSKLMWEEIGNIKELKSGYLSFVVNKIVNIAIEEGALIVLENLNFGFKKNRTSKFEKAVYQKFEVALATKLQYVVLKNKEDLELGGVLRGYQLAPKLDNISDLDKNNSWGIIKYVIAAYTSKIDPVSGWRQHNYLPSNSKDIKEYFDLKSDNYIEFIWSKNHQCYGFQYSNANEVNQLLAHSEIERIGRVKDEKTKSMKDVIFNSQQINEKFSKLILPESKDKDIVFNNQIMNNPEFKWKELAYLYQLVSKIRNKIDEVDVIQSPVFSSKINGFFDSRNYELYKSKYKLILPIDGDANGSYHVALNALKEFKKTDNI